jgi:hypothetical protein
MEYCLQIGENMSASAEKLDQVPTLFEQAAKHLEVAKEFKITSREQYNQADGDLVSVMSLHKKLDTMRKEEKEPHDKAAKAVQDKYREPMSFLDKAKSLLKQSMYAYQKAEDDRRARQAEEERKRIERNAEKRAETAMAKGDEDTSHQIIQEAAIEAQTAKAVISTPSSKSKVSRRSKYEAVLLDMRELLQAILDGKAPIGFVAFDQSQANKYAQATKGEMPVPGISFKDVGIVAASRGR